MWVIDESTSMWSNDVCNKCCGACNYFKCDNRCIFIEEDISCNNCVYTVGGFDAKIDENVE